MRLVYKETQQEVKVGDVFINKDGDALKVTYFKEPHKSSSGGKVSVEINGGPGEMEYYVSVIGAKWIEREDQGWKPQ